MNATPMGCPSSFVGMSKLARSPHSAKSFRTASALASQG
eukprot:CAMPEP_0185907908 /NCGR_PEP_ID=MMETSP0196C-20130402/7878_1 /TAXON_ID=2932 /ORGANISM="Alexandrium fundyense, Strain CCMP1719" /LENGTH=38 /DNA_ID= /DNA_START= /DNA_END= /DNA_ORIENTATION=